jgi:hypothetical protein
MSKLEIRSRGLGSTFELNVLQFSAPVVASISTLQTRTMVQHYPIKVNQAEVNFLVQFASETEYEEFQMFVRRTQTTALTNGRYPGVTLWWPERDIKNWTGVIKEFRAGGARANYAPRAQFTVSLIDSMVAKETLISSIVSDWRTILQGSGGLLSLPALITETLTSLIGPSASGVPSTNSFSDNITSGSLGLPSIFGGSF